MAVRDLFRLKAASAAFERVVAVVSRIAVIFIIVIAALSAACRQQPDQSKSPRLQVVTTLFPLYEFARTIGGDRAEVRFLLPPGTEPHNFEPRPDDMARINRAGLFVFTNRFMEPWAATLAKGTDPARTGVVDASKGIDLADAKAVPAHGGIDAVSPGHAHEKEMDGKDPHLWLDFSLASRMVDNILAGFVARDPKNSAYYTENAALCRKRLAELDERYRERLSVCRGRTMLTGGHDAFGYLARRYGIVSVAATGVSANAEPTPARMAELVRQVKTSGAKAIFAEELVSPRLAETLAAETGAVVLRINAGHNVARDDLARGVTFMGLMEENLEVLSQGLGCSR